MRKVFLGSAGSVFSLVAACSIGTREEGDDENTGGAGDATGGKGTGGRNGTGGVSTGGVSTGGVSTGGVSTGGVSTGGDGDAGSSGRGEGGEGGAPAEPTGLSWPIDCVPGESCVGI